MVDAIIRYVDFPISVRGLITIDADGAFNIYINEKLSDDGKRDAILHELAHLASDHLGTDVSAAECEQYIDEHLNVIDALNLIKEHSIQLSYG